MTGRLPRPPLRHTLRATATAAVLGITLLGSLAPPAWADNKLEGYYEAEVSAQKEDGKWHFGSPGANGMPKHYTELKFWSRPSDRFEVFAKLRAESNRDDDRSASVDFYAPPWFNGEGHIKLRQNKYEAFIFYRQNRFYINDEPLLRLVDDGRLKNDDWGPKAQGIRLDFWDSEFLGIRNLSGTVIASDNGGTFNSNETDIANGENSTIVRVRHKGWDGRIETGAMFIRKDWTDTSQPNWPDLLGLMYNNVYSADLAFSPRNLITTGLRVGPVNLEQSRWTVEAAISEQPFDVEVFNTSTARSRAIAVEMRDIHIHDVTVHAWYNDFGEDFRDFSSSRFDNGGEYNRIQKHVEGIWLVPKKSVTAKISYDTFRKRFADEPGGGLRPSTQWYGEVYMEYINGFKSRVSYANWHGFDTDASVFEFTSYPNWFAEISVENFLAKIRLQGRIRDAGTFRQLTSFGFDMSVNLTDRLKGYLRALNVNENTEARHTIFAQLKYDIGWGSEIYFEYGDAGQSDNLVYTDWFVQEDASANLSDRFKLLVKAWF